MGDTNSECAGQRSTGKFHLVQNTTLAAVVFVPCALASMIAWMLCNRLNLEK